MGHIDGRPKARFFARFGFKADDWKVLADALKQHAVENEVQKTVSSSFGVRYIIDGELVAPDGRRPTVRVVWFISKGADIPMLVTAYPVRSKTR